MIHGWDLAVVAGRDATIDPQLADAMLADPRTMIDQHLRAPDGALPVFAQPVPAPTGASATDHLIAFLGRAPDWTLTR